MAIAVTNECTVDVETSLNDSVEQVETHLSRKVSTQTDLRMGCHSKFEASAMHKLLHCTCTACPFEIRLGKRNGCQRGKGNWTLGAL